jgi:homoserine kinase
VVGTVVDEGDVGAAIVVAVGRLTTETAVHFSVLPARVHLKDAPFTFRITPTLVHLVPETSGMLAASTE